jgi:hypothetical protein
MGGLSDFERGEIVGVHLAAAFVAKQFLRLCRHVQASWEDNMNEEKQ